MTDQAPQKISAAEAEFVKTVAEFDTKLVNVLTDNTLPFELIVQMLVTHASTICIYNKINRAQFMELVRTMFTRCQAMNKDGLIQDGPKEESKITLASK